jgi:hypothetical protein
MPFGPLSDKGGSAPHDFERIDGGKLRCTGASWDDALVIMSG